MTREKDRKPKRLEHHLPDESKCTFHGHHKTLEKQEQNKCFFFLDKIRIVTKIDCIWGHQINLTS